MKAYLSGACVVSIMLFVVFCLVLGGVSLAGMDAEEFFARFPWIKYDMIFVAVVAVVFFPFFSLKDFQ